MLNIFGSATLQSNATRSGAPSGALKFPWNKFSETGMLRIPVLILNLLRKFRGAAKYVQHYMLRYNQTNKVHAKIEDFIFHWCPPQRDEWGTDFRFRSDILSAFSSRLRSKRVRPKAPVTGMLRIPVLISNYVCSECPDRIPSIRPHPAERACD